ncbi:MAG: hypothetical protein LBI04_11065 [Treponema sp.]|jgi:hypothetical protein|nr:hypothetical protein [Treponema sp.]
MYQIDKIELCNDKSERVWVHVWAEIENSCLKISGHDLGNAPNELLGSDEFEYWYNFDEKNTEALISLLTKDENDIKNVLLENFGGLDGCNKLKEFCNKNGIEYKYMSWY